MATITVNGIAVELRNRENLIETIEDMVIEYSTPLREGKVKNKAKRQAEIATVSFFGSIKHYLEGGIEG